MRFAISAALGCLLCVVAVAAPDLNNPSSVVISESSSGAVIAVEIPEPTLSVLDRGSNGDALYVEIPGAIPDFDESGVVLPTITKLLEVPDGFRVEARVKSARMQEFSADAMIPRDRMERTLRGTSELPLVEVGAPGWMRWLKVAPVIIRPASYDAAENKILVAENMEIEFEYIPDNTVTRTPPDVEKYWSLEYQTLFKELLLNPREINNVQPGGRVVVRGSYIIITDSSLIASTTQFAEWKRSKGFNVVVAPIYRRGISAEEIRTYIQNAYDTWERPPEYVLLLGDINASIQLPAFRITNPFPGINEIDVTDLPYSCTAGDDYFPDLFIGRVSSDAPNSTIAQNYFARALRHETNAVNFPDSAFSRAVVYAGNRGDGNSPVLSPVETAEWLAQRLREKNYAVYTQMWRQAGDPDDPAPLVEAINRGVNIVSYRGWADATGTHYPRFYKANLDQLNNGPLLPILTFFVCNTGDFDNDLNPLCFGEYSICRGSRQNPTGGIAFFGPSDLHTKTTFNNSMLAGYYYGMINQGLRSIGSLALRAKMEVWRTNPHVRDIGGNSNFVEFYFSVYNILGDPELPFYFRKPYRLTVTSPQLLSVGETNATITVKDPSDNPVIGALVTLRKGDETNITVMTDADGVAMAPVNLLTPDTLRVTVIAYQAGAAQLKIPVASNNNRFVGLHTVTVRNNQGNDAVYAGTPLDLTVNLKNFGANVASGLSATLTSPLENVEIIEGESSFGDVAAGATAASATPFRIKISSAYGNGATIPLSLSIHDGQGQYPTALFRLKVTNGSLGIVSHQFEHEDLMPGAVENLTITLTNYGDLPLQGVHATLNCFDNSVDVVDGQATFGNIATGAEVSCANDPFRIHLLDDVAIGRQIKLRIKFLDSNDTVLTSKIINIVAGRPGPTDPVGPDGYGYYAYDNVDENYAKHPTYDWVELDPDFGGENATKETLADDQTFIVELPFQFKFYGNNYNSISVCSNGWASFERTVVWDFNNWPIGSPLGPHTMICPLWEDLVGPRIGETQRDSINVFHRYDEADNRFIIEWSRAIARSGNDFENVETFEIILLDPAHYRTATGDGEILFQYEEVHVVDRGQVPYDYATIGIQDWNHSRGIELTFANFPHPSAAEFTAGRAILFTTEPPDNYLSERGGQSDIPVEFNLGEVYPNPFNSHAMVNFAMPRNGMVKVGIYDLGGRQLQDLGYREYSAGNHMLEFNAKELPSGLYMLRFETSGKIHQRKLTLLR